MDSELCTATLTNKLDCKVNSVQEDCAKCFANHILRSEILQITWKNETKHQTLSFQFFTNRFSILMFFILFFHVVCKISNFNKWTAKYLAQASRSCTELTLKGVSDLHFGNFWNSWPPFTSGTLEVKWRTLFFLLILIWKKWNDQFWTSRTYCKTQY